MSLFPFIEYWPFYTGFIVFVMAIVVLDLGIFHRHAHAVSFKEAVGWSCVWVALSLLFNFGLYHFSLWQFTTNPLYTNIPNFDAALTAKQVALEFLTGYVIEKALAVDNIFVFVMIFSFFMVPLKYQHRILFYGVIGALVFRAIFISVGAVLMQYHTIVIIFGVFLMITGLKIIFMPEKPKDLSQNFLIKLIKRVLPVTDQIHDGHFFIKKGRKFVATPLFLTLVFIEFSDIIFAADSVPAIFAITKEPLIVFTSNIMAILGLRSLYFLLASIVDRFHLLKYGLAVILIFVGIKMTYLNEVYNGKFPISYSLSFIGLVLGMAIFASMLFKKAEELK